MTTAELSPRLFNLEQRTEALIYSDLLRDWGDDEKADWLSSLPFGAEAIKTCIADCPPAGWTIVAHWGDLDYCVSPRVVQICASLGKSASLWSLATNVERLGDFICYLDHDIYGWTKGEKSPAIGIRRLLAELAILLNVEKHHPALVRDIILSAL